MENTKRLGFLLLIAGCRSGALDPGVEQGGAVDRAAMESCKARSVAICTKDPTCELKYENPCACTPLVAVGCQDATTSSRVKCAPCPSPCAGLAEDACNANSRCVADYCSVDGVCAAFAGCRQRDAVPKVVCPISWPAGACNSSCQADYDCAWSEISGEIRTKLDCPCLFGCPSIPMDRKTADRRNAQYKALCTPYKNGKGESCPVDDCAAPVAISCRAGLCVAKQ